ncbi:hypothetical protein M8J77_017114 [Diaphorina citri]|jgi:BTB/POZ domain./BTB And C-terminal Kelch.|nr:hypothetical protein M8J77_017114 [Diaphorina citri]
MKNPDITYDKTKILQRNISELLNQPESSDIVLVVNNARYYACSYILASSSNVMKGMVKSWFQDFQESLNTPSYIQFPASTKLECLVPDVKSHESFYNILKYIYGAPIKLGSLSASVLCEMVRLAHVYDLTEFHEDIKCYLSKVKNTRIKIHSSVILLNTAYTFDIKHLYERVKRYICQHSESFLRHESFAELQYPVLLDLLQSKWFYSSSEITILREVLIWHDKNILDTKSKSACVLLDQSSNVVSLEGESSSTTAVKIDSMRDTADVNLGEFFESVDPTHTSRKISPEIFELFDEDEDQDIKNLSFFGFKQLTDDDTKRIEKVETDFRTKVDAFSESVLISLLKYIRFPNIPIFDYLKSLEVNRELFSRYKMAISAQKDAVYISEPREFCNGQWRTKTFTMRIPKKFQEGKELKSSGWFRTKGKKAGYWSIVGKYETVEQIKYLNLLLKHYPHNMDAKNMDNDLDDKDNNINNDPVDVIDESPFRVNTVRAAPVLPTLDFRAPPGTLNNPKDKGNNSHDMDNNPKDKDNTSHDMDKNPEDKNNNPDNMDNFPKYYFTLLSPDLFQHDYVGKQMCQKGERNFITYAKLVDFALGKDKVHKKYMTIRIRAQLEF